MSPTGKRKLEAAWNNCLRIYSTIAYGKVIPVRAAVRCRPLISSTMESDKGIPVRVAVRCRPLCLSYKLTHLYFNCPGTIRVPAPCQYAYKLTFLAGQSLHGEHSLHLASTLFYL
ncbi:hypothetical protein HPB49_012045 [Dermacentor silvarum]|uniref:Uncharacterized protein n=1 Tax=Dermacentor silvarum TaxID=543639 RepID=A0ACB8DZR1_DERSI|nr:hypothetical protein HPB49_012045 [Dermacentor silvarum]